MGWKMPTRPCTCETWTVLTVNPDNQDKDGIKKLKGESHGSKFSLGLDVGEVEKPRSQYSYTGQGISWDIFIHPAAVFGESLLKYVQTTSLRFVD